MERKTMITIDRIIEDIGYKPVSKFDSLDGVWMVSYRRKEGWEPNLEFSKKPYDENGHYFYYDLVNFGNGYNGELISLKENDRRKDIYTGRYINEENYEEIIGFVRKSMRRLYAKARVS